MTYSYDRQGNMLSDGRNRYAYDDFGRLASAVTAEGDIQKNCYDAEGLRAEMEENGRLVQFLYNEDREVVAEKDYSGNIIRYIRGLGLISSDSENAKTYYHYVCDGQGSVSHIIRGEDKESGVSEQGREQDRILNQYEYDAFGNTISCKEQVENRFRYQGEQYDPITRQYYLRARYYNPVIGRFIQEDTYYGDGLNLYDYCRNNTITYKDPTGHNICPTQRDLYHKYKEEGMSPQEAYQKMRKELGLDSKSGYKDSGVGKGKDPWRGYESGSGSTTGENARILSNNLAREGRPVGNGEAAAHIVASNGTKRQWASAADSRTLLMKYDIDINDAANGIPLGHPRPHNLTHNRAFHENVNARLHTVETDMLNNGYGKSAIRSALRRELRSIGREFENGIRN